MTRPGCDDRLRPPRRAAREPMVVVVTGLSGAGRTTALRALEDLGFFCIDNLPTVARARCGRALREGRDDARRARHGRARSRVPRRGRPRALAARGRRPSRSLTCSSSTPPTRRSCAASARRAARMRSRRPARSSMRGVACSKASPLERERLAPLRARATRVIDTTRLSVHELRRARRSRTSARRPGRIERMTVRVLSFGFKYGAPADADLVFDVRFLKNPYFVPELKRVPGHRSAGARFRARPTGDRGVFRRGRSTASLRRAEVRARRQELPYHRVRMHRGDAPQRRARRARCRRARRDARIRRAARPRPTTVARIATALDSRAWCIATWRSDGSAQQAHVRRLRGARP